MKIRPFDPARDQAACERIWREAGWLDDNDREREAMTLFTAACTSIVGEIAGGPECLVNTSRGTFRFLDETLVFEGVMGVVTSRIARKRGYAGRLTARALANAAAAGVELAGLSTFEDGYYNRLGFGPGPTEVLAVLDPSWLAFDAPPPRVPRRIEISDFEAVHASRLRRRPVHGTCSFHDERVTRAEMMWHKNGFGFAYEDEPDGGLSHLVWFGGSSIDTGPLTVHWMTWRTREQFLELMGLIRSLDDQIHAVRMIEPVGIQLQDFMRRPFYRHRISKRTDLETSQRAMAWWQLRVLDLPACLAKTHLSGGPLRFNLDLEDPIEKFLDDDIAWRGVGGQYIVELGPSSGCEHGHDDTLPTLLASVGAFTRLWVGARPASGLVFTDRLSAPQELIEALDETLRLPVPQTDWDF